MKISRILACCGAIALVSGLTLAGQKDKKGDAEKGKEVFQQCAVCHNADSTEKKMGPGLKGLFSREKMNNGKKPTEANVREKIDEGGQGMPAYKEMLSDEEKDEWDETEWGEDEDGNPLDPPEEVDAAKLNKWLFNEDTVDKVLEYLMTDYMDHLKHHLRQIFPETRT